MNKMKGNSIGISLILVVFILLCLITFGTLSFMLSNADNEMSISTAENVIEFYNGDMVAQEKLQSIDGILADTYGETSDAAEYFAELEVIFQSDADVEMSIDEDGYYLQFTTTVSDVEVLISQIEIYYPAEEGYYRIESWTLENISSL